MAAEPNELQKKVLGVIAESIEARGFPPTLREIGRRCGISSTGSVSFHLKALERLGLLKRLEAASRGLELLEDPFRLPVLGRVGAGGQVLAQEDVEGRVSVDKSVSRGAQFLLRVRGESMTGEGIREGDLVLVRRQESARDGELVVAVVGEETGVVKRYRAKGPALESAHPDYAPITEPFRIVGKVVGLQRRYE